MAGHVVKHVILTGPPGIGKTTLMRMASDRISEKGITLQGFITEELRVRCSRSGFDVVTIDEQRAPLARISEDGAHAALSSHGMPSNSREYRVGRYTVNVAAFERTALPTLKVQKDVKVVYIIDEVGKMELFSNPFKRAVQNLLDHPDATIFATIPVPKARPIPFVEHLRSRRDVKLFTISQENRDSILDEIVDAVLTAHQGAPR